MSKLEENIAVIAGGSTGMGWAIAKLFVREGASAVITGRDQASLDAAARSIGNGVEEFRSDIAAVADLELVRDHVKATPRSRLRQRRPRLHPQTADCDLALTRSLNTVIELSQSCELISSSCGVEIARGGSGSRAD